MPDLSLQLDAVFHALADPTRRAILLQLSDGERSVNELAGGFDISLPAVAKHLRTLEHAGLIRCHKLGRRRLCRSQPDNLRQASRWIEFYQRFWDERLENLKLWLEQGIEQHVED